MLWIMMQQFRKEQECMNQQASRIGSSRGSPIWLVHLCYKIWHMTQKELTEALVDKLLQTIDPSEIADDSRQTIEILLNLVEQLNSK